MDANLSVRIVTAAVALPVLIWLVGWSPPWMFPSTLFVLTVAALYDFFALAFPHSWKDQSMGVIFGLGLSAVGLLDAHWPAVQWLRARLLFGFPACVCTPG